MRPLETPEVEPSVHHTYPNIHPGSAAMGATTVSTLIGTIGTYSDMLAPILQDLAYLVAIISGGSSLYFYWKKK